VKTSRLLPLLLVLCAAYDLLSADRQEPLMHTTTDPVLPAAPPAAVAAGARATDHFPTSSGDLAVVPLEHASLLFVWRGLAIYVDPTSPFVDDATLPKADLVFVTDAHYDHFDPFALPHLRKPGTVVVAPASADARAPVDVVVGEGDARTLSGVEMTGVPAYNVVRGAGPGLRYHDRGKALGYLLDFGGTRVYVSGDTECTPEMRSLAGVDVAFVSMNVPYAMTAAEATTCVAAFRPRVVFPYAYRHAVPSTLDTAALGQGIEVRRREFYPRAADARARAYVALTRGMWGAADDLLDSAKRLDPAGDADWRVQWTRQWLREYERPWPW
jgi:L-ascorbate metabolism protein UlaG (beta-lactamase superfamily)